MTIVWTKETALGRKRKAFWKDMKEVKGRGGKRDEF